MASANNAAVENVTAEVPVDNAIAGQWRADRGYFTALGTKILLHPRMFKRRTRVSATGDPPDRRPITWLPLY
ncbi:hypothetical protein [Nocardioides sp. GXZ039]|uniref:hypothetical protein n=1 Tax=Nocardioides sp. GXZ039 TaxID=3136018 RepID=UPI0030F42CA6